MKLNAILLNIFNNVSGRTSNNVNSEYKNTIFEDNSVSDNPIDQWKQTAKECGMDEEQFKKAVSYMFKNFPEYVPAGVRQDKNSQAFTFVLKRSYTNETFKIWYKNGELIYDMAKLRKKAFECKMNDKDFMSAMEYIKTKYEGCEIKKIKEHFDKKTQTREIIFVLKDAQNKKLELSFINGKIKDDTAKPLQNNEQKPVQAERTQPKQQTTPTQQAKPTQQTTQTQTQKNVQTVKNTSAVKGTTQTTSVKNPAKPEGLDAFYSSIPKSYDAHIKKAAKDAKVSENFIRHLITCEGRDSKACLNAYKCKNGIWTIGFGHTNATGVNPFVKSDKTTITLEQAFQYLVDDIKVHREDCTSWLGDKFKNAPKHIQEGIIDRSFQAGQRGFRDETLKANLGDADCYPAFIARCLWVRNDGRRSALRFLLAADGLDNNYQGSARRWFTKLGHEKEVLDTLRGAEKIYFKQGFGALGNN